MPECLAVEPDAERLADQAVGAVTPHEIVGLDALKLPAVQIDDLRRHARPRRLEAFEPRPISQANLGKCASEALQNGIEPHLRAYLMPHWAVGLWLLARARPEHDPAEFIASEAGHKSYIA